jgi:hypothetical protein
LLNQKCVDNDRGLL